MGYQNEEIVREAISQVDFSVLFREKNPLNNNSFASFYIRAPKTWSNQEIFDVWDLISDEIDAFAAKEGHDNLMEVCNVAVSDRY